MLIEFDPWNNIQFENQTFLLQGGAENGAKTAKNQYLGQTYIKLTLDDTLKCTLRIKTEIYQTTDIWEDKNYAEAPYTAEAAEHKKGLISGINQL